MKRNSLRLIGRLAVGIFIGSYVFLAGVEFPNANAASFLQPTVNVPVVMQNADGTVNVVVEVNAVTDVVRLDATDTAKTVTLTSGVYDLRLFRDAQLIGTSTPREKSEQ